MKIRAAVGIGAIAVLVGGCVGLEWKERELVFRPTREPAGWFGGTPDAVQELYLTVGANAERMHAWWWPADDPRAPVVYYLHGVRWNLTGNLNRISQLRRFGFSVFAIDYRGFGKSDGDLPSEESVYEDARAGWQWLVGREPDASRRFIYGHSLGGAVAVELAVRLASDGTQARGLIVESSFTSLGDMVSELSKGWLPIGPLLSQKFDSIEKIGQIRMPVLIVHGGGDRFVPARFGEALYAAAPEPKKLLLVQNGSHNNSMLVGDADYRQALREFFGPLGESPVGIAERSWAVRPVETNALVNRTRDVDVFHTISPASN
jgi:hypothetical protein